MRLAAAVLLVCNLSLHAQSNWDRLKSLYQPSSSRLADAARETSEAVLQLHDPRTAAAARDRLIGIDRKNLALFQEIEEKLQGAGLADKVDQWREFVRHYQSQMRRARAGLRTASVDDDAGSRGLPVPRQGSEAQVF